jgi:hypothetical protein
MTRPRRKQRPPTKDPTPAAQSWRHRLVWVSMGLAVVILFGLWPLRGGDLWAHLAVGKAIGQRWDIPRVNNFTFVNAGAEFIAHSWGAELIFYGLEQTAGTFGFALLRLSLVSLALWCALRVARLLGAPWPAVMLLTPVVLVMVWGRLEFRPQLFSTAGLAFQLWLIASVHTGQRSPRWLWILPPLYAAWINLHPGWPQGLAMLVGITAALVAMQARRRWLGTGGTSGMPMKTLALVLVACVAALFLNPYGARLVYFPLEMQAPWIRADGTEWQSPFGNTGWSRVGGGRLVSLQPIFFLYLTILMGMWLVAVRRWRTADLVPPAVMAFWLMMSAWHLRAVSDATLLSAPCVAAGLGSVWWRRQTWPVWVGTGLTLTLASVAVWVAWPFDTWEWKEKDPRCLMARLARPDLSARVAVAAPRLGYPWLLYHFYPRFQAHDHWEYVIGEAAHREHLTIVNGEPAGLIAFLDRYEVGTMIISNVRTEGYRDLQARGWVFIHMDNQYSIMVRRTPETAALIAREEYRWIKAWVHPPRVTAENAGEVLQEAQRALRYCPDEATFAWAYQAEALSLLGRHDEALAAARMIPREIVIK